MSNEKWKCPNCGIENDAENAFCGECGTKKLERETRIAAAGRVIPKEEKPEPVTVQERGKEKPKSKKGIIIALIVVFVTGIIIAVVLGGSSEQPSNSGDVPPVQSYDRQEAERRAAAEAEKRAAEEAERQKKAAAEAKADAERQKAAAEAEKRAAEEAERQKKAAAEAKADAERQKAAAEAERQKAEAATRAKLQKWEQNHLLTSGLYWIDGGKKTWAAARSYCSSFTDREMGFSGWRLPTVDELKRLNGKKRDRYWNSSSYSFWDNRNGKQGTDDDDRHKVEYMFYCVRNK